MQTRTKKAIIIIMIIFVIIAISIIVYNPSTTSGTAYEYNYKVVIESNNSSVFEIITLVPLNSMEEPIINETNYQLYHGEVLEISLKETEFGLGLSIKGEGNVSLEFVGNIFGREFSLLNENKDYYYWMYSKYNYTKVELSYYSSYGNYAEHLYGEREWISGCSTELNFNQYLSKDWDEYNIYYETICFD